MSPRSRSRSTRHAVRGSILHFRDDPARHVHDETGAFEYHEDGLLVIEDGQVRDVGSASALLAALAPGTPVEELTGMLVLPGFIDAHTHFVQTDIIGSHGRRLLEWLERYTFPAERAFADPTHAQDVAEFFVRELLRNGTTTALVMGSVHAASVDAIFASAQRRGMQIGRAHV